MYANAKVRVAYFSLPFHQMLAPHPMGFDFIFSNFMCLFQMVHQRPEIVVGLGTTFELALLPHNCKHNKNSTFQSDSMLLLAIFNAYAFLTEAPVQKMFSESNQFLDTLGYTEAKKILTNY